MNRVTVNASKDYNIYIGSGLLKNCGEMIKNEIKGSSSFAAVITDDIVDGIYGDTVIKSLNDAGFKTVKYVFPHSEESKSLETYSDIINFLARNHLTRTDILVSLGGGIPGDMGGFAAATYLRGIKFIQIPTTLLSAVDSSVGGKTAVNLPTGKNLVGAFYQPDLVICDYDTLNTLPGEIFADGCAEVIKYGVIMDKEFFDFLKNNSIKDNIEYVISRCVELKRDIVDSDEKETGIRAILNFGHTVGHAIEINSDFEISHGSAVAIGMIIASKGAFNSGLCKADFSEEIKDVLIKNSLPVSCPFGSRELFDVSCSDKKRSGDTIKLIIPEEMGKCVIKKIPLTSLLDFIEKGL